jgi:hypothetical protein
VVDEIKKEHRAAHHREERGMPRLFFAQLALTQARLPCCQIVFQAGQRFPLVSGYGRFHEKPVEFIPQFCYIQFIIVKQ